MSQIYINFFEVREANRRLPSIESRLKAVRISLSKLCCQIPVEIGGQYQIKDRLNRVYADIRGMEAELEALYQAAEACVGQYEQAGYENSRNAEAFL